MASVRIFFTAMIALVLSSVSAQAISVPGTNLKTNSDPNFQVTKIQLAIKQGTNGACPVVAEMTGWVFTNKPGTFQYFLARKGGAISGPFTLQSKKGSDGLSAATFSRTLNISQSTNAEYKILLAGDYGNATGKWVPMRVKC